jgi:hypothetical protein
MNQVYLVARVYMGYAKEHASDLPGNLLFALEIIICSALGEKLHVD